MRPNPRFCIRMPARVMLLKVSFLAFVLTTAGETYDVIYHTPLLPTRKLSIVTKTQATMA